MKLQALSGSHNVFSQHHAPIMHVTRSLQDAPPTMVERSSATTSTCTSANCKTPAQTENTTDIIVGLTVAIPLVTAAIVMFFLHRRVKRKQALEDKNDKYRSYDFGMEDVPAGKKGGAGLPQAKLPEMTITDMEKETMSYGQQPHKSHKGGMSLDMMNSPYLLPAAVNDSGESFHSMSRTLRDGDDPYRPVTMALSEAGSSNTHVQKGGRYDNDSIYTGSSIPTGGDAMNDGLLKNARPMSHSDPFASPDSSPASLHPPEYPAPVAQRKRSPTLAVDSNNPPARTNYAQQSPVTTTPRHNIPSVHVAAFDEVEEHEPFALTPPSPPADHDTHPIASPAPVHTAERVSISVTPAADDSAPRNNRMSVANQNNRMSMAGLRPLPPDDPADNPEQRALRIRSFYKEYFDDSKPNPSGTYPQFNPYTEDLQGEHFEEGTAVYDPETGAFITHGAPTMAPPAPWAEPMARRAFTPPPGGAMPRGRVRSNTSFQSTGHINNPAFQNGPRAQPKKPLPPPAALKSLPTPHALKDDLAFINPLDFAPPQTFRDEQLGRGRDSPTGSLRPYSPAVQAHNPLVQSFDDLAALPSPHLLRKSGTFTSLDFAPPPKFRNEEGTRGGGSDAGSIRSNRSGISAVQNNAIRAGAYRVSRLPQDMVGTRDDLSMALKPSWELRGVNPQRT